MTRVRHRPRTFMPGHGLPSEYQAIGATKRQRARGEKTPTTLSRSVGDSPARFGLRFAPSSSGQTICRHVLGRGPRRANTKMQDRERQAMSNSRPTTKYRFGRDIGRFGRVWSRSTKSYSRDGVGLKYDLVDLVDIHRRGVCAYTRRARTPACARALPSVSPEQIDQIDQIGQKLDAVYWLGFGSPRPNRRFLDQMATKSRPNRLVEGVVGR